MSDLLEILEQGRRSLNTQFEKAVSKTVARVLLGHEVDGYDYLVPPATEKRDGYFPFLSNLWRKVFQKEKDILLPTSITLDYRKDTWGLERIVLDVIANHLPADSKGTTISVKLKQNGKYVALKDADEEAKTTEVVFEDDGSGYDYRLLSFLFSTKGVDTFSIGQFGEGLKLIAAAALRQGISIEYRSQNWRARPTLEEHLVDDQKIKQLCFQVSLRKDQIKSSRTVFVNPPEDFLDEIYGLPNNVLALNDRYTEWYAPHSFLAHPSRILDLGEGNPPSLFVKGIRFSWSGKSLFSYDLGIDNISPDRKTADRDTVLGQIRYLLKNCDNPTVIHRILQEAHDQPDFYHPCTEFEALGKSQQDSLTTEEFPPRFVFKQPLIKTIRNGIKEFAISELSLIEEKLRSFDYTSFTKSSPRYQSPWARIFQEMYGDDAIIASTNTNENADAELMGYRPITLHPSVAMHLNEVGIKRADVLIREINSETEYRWVEPADLTREEQAVLSRADDLSRIVLGEVIPVNVRVYSGLYTKAGRKIIGSLGVHTTLPDGTKYIGIMRDQLGDLKNFADTYIHELGHHVTGAGDYDRTFVDFFTQALARIAAERLSPAPPKPL